MKKAQLTLTLLLLAAVTVSAQQIVVFFPDWKVGDKRTAISVNKEVEYKDGELIKEEEEVSSVKFEVTGETDRYFMVKIIYENVFLAAAKELYEENVLKSSKLRDLELLYQVDKATGKGELTNWKEAQSFIKGSFDEILNLIKKKDKEEYEMAELMFKPLLSIFESKEGIEAYMDDDIKLLTMVFGKPFRLNDSIVEEEVEANPLNPAAMTTVKHVYRLTEKDAGMYNIDYDIQFDMAEFTTMIKDMIASMSQMMGSNDDKLKELDDITFEMTNHTVLTYNSRTSWIEQMEFSALVYGKDPKGEHKKEITKVVVIQ